MKLFLAFVLFVSTLSLHTGHSIDHLLTRPIPHMQASVNKPSSDTEIDDIKTLVDSVNKALTSKDANKYEFLITKTT